MPGFLDYTVVKPTQKKAKSGRALVAANVRYTSRDETIVLKGQYLDPRQAQSAFRERLKQFVDSADYAGVGYSRGDRWLRQVAFEGYAIGRSSDWRRADVCHHVTAVVDEIAGLMGSVGQTQVS